MIMALPTADCFKWLDRRDQVTAIYESLYEASPDTEGLTTPECFKGEDQREQLTDIYAAILSITS